jgi:hypothetical protein
MSDEQPHPHPGALTETQRSRIHFARRDLETARVADLAQLDAASLILLVERLRGRLGDMLDLADEIALPS